MKKFSFLIPVATAAAALSHQAQAKIDETPSAKLTDTRKAVSGNEGVGTSGLIEQFYVKDGELHSLIMKAAESGVMLAGHSSHSSHGSHSSHRSSY